jgi:predicted transcriptional regulator
VTKQIAPYEVRLYFALSENSSTWMSVRALAAVANVNTRSINRYLLRFTKLGICEFVRSTTGYLYKFSPAGSKKNLEYVKELMRARVAFKEYADTSH